MTPPDKEVHAGHKKKQKGGGFFQGNLFALEFEQEVKIALSGLFFG